jgi:outer membrane receptor protein involved in Fe transport
MTRIEHKLPGIAAFTLAVISFCLGPMLGLQGGQARADGLADEAELHFQIAAEHYQKGEFREALEHFLFSNRLVPNKKVVFNIATTCEQLRRFADAHRYYVDALGMEDTPQTINDINAAIQRITPNVAVLDVETTPPGATIYIDRRDLGSRGRSPRPLALPEGRYRVIAELDGYEPTTSAEIEIRLGSRVKIPLTLRRIVGTVRVSLANAGAALVRVDDEKGPISCVAPCDIEVPPGRHLLYFAREGYHAAPRPVDVIERRTVQVTADLHPLTGSLVVSTTEREAMVEIDGHPMGFTPAVIQNVAAGRRHVRISLRGYAPIEREVEIKADNQERLVDLELTPLRQVDAASRYAESIDDAPSSVSIITREELRAFGYPTIAEALRGVRGVYLSNDRTYVSPGIRGLGEPNDYGNRVLVLADGQSLNDNILNSSFIGSDARVDLDDIERIEVVRGPGSVLYGTGAFSGVINLVPHERDAQNSVHASAGTYDNSVARARAGFHYNISPRAAVEASVSLARSDGVDVPIAFVDSRRRPPVAIANNVDFFRSGGTAGRATLGPLTAQWFFHRREQHIPIGIFETIFNDPRTEYTDTRMMAELRYEPRLSPTIQLMTRVHANRYVFYSDLAYDPLPGPTTIEDYAGTWFGTEARLVWTPSRVLRFTLGGESQVHPEATIEGGFPKPYVDVRKPYKFGAGYSLLEAAPAPWFRLSAGSRLDVYSTFGPIFVPRVALILNTGRFPGSLAVEGAARGSASPRASTKRTYGVLKLMGGRAFRAPSIYEQFYTDGRTQLPAVDPARRLRLGPESIYSGEIEYSQRFEEDWVALGATHISYIKGIINTVPDAVDPMVIRYANSAKPSLAAGFEVELRREFRQGLMFGVSYGYERARYLDRQNHDPRLINAPEHLASIRGVIPIIPDLASLGVRATLEAPRRISLTRDDLTRTAVVADLTLSGGVRRYGLGYVLGVYNVIDARYEYPVTETYLSRTVLQNGQSFLAELTFTYP